MKKAKILLTAIGVFAIIGGALAFKANRNAVIYCSTTSAIAGQCNISLPNFTLAPFEPAFRGWCTANSAAACTRFTGLAELM